MARWGAEDDVQQQSDVGAAPQSAATSATQGCVCPPKPVDPPTPVNPPINPPVPVDPPKVIPVIVKVEWLDGPGTGVLAGEGLQFVNMPVEDKWVGGQLAKNKRRLSHQPGYKVTFNQPGSHSFKVRLLPGASNAAYTATEEPRNGKFKAEKEWVSGSTDGDGTKVIEVGSALTVAGGDSYKLEAQDDKATLVTSSNIKTIRALHVLKLKMRTLTSVAASIAGCVSEYVGHHIRLVELADVEIPHQPNIGSNADSATLNTNVAAAWDSSQGKAKAPYALGIVFTDHLAVKNPAQTLEKTGVAVGPGQPALPIPIAGAGLLDPFTVGARRLWRELVPGEGWYVSATYTPDGGGAPVDMPEALFTPSTATGAAWSVSANVSGLPAGTGTVSLTLNWVDRMRMGIAISGPSVLVCTRVNWRDVTSDEQNQTLVHELGHKFGMVPEGTGSELDNHADQYTGHGHAGSHCHHGIAAQANYSGASGSDCVMFGAITGNIAYCALCAPQMKKVDLTAGW